MKAKEKTSEVNNFNNKREFYRIDLEHTLGIDTILYKINDNLINKKIGLVESINISAGGLSFISPLKLMDMGISNQVLYLFKFKVNSNHYELPGTLVRSEVLTNGNYKYGAQFNIDKSVQCSLLSDLHQLAHYNKKGIKFKERFSYFN